ncbi:c-type cytochrome [Luteimonas aquatica]|uniref:c-type cytochrome n=1 Tax=Luteimonas aquatica TaxID=450364 RepID=UPI001F57C66B|nr:cytochrome c [Luteimonas aquatica]
MTRRARPRWGRRLAWLLLIVLLWLLVLASMRFFAARGPVQRVSATPAQIAHGRYLADAADCAACHTAPGGAPFAGGLPLASPFGTIYATNITPDPEHGIGRYTAEDFYRALAEGEARDGHQLYPAMPYASYRQIARADSDAIYAYLMQQPPVARPNSDNDLAFPFNIRPGIHAWNLLFANRQAPATSQGASSAWQRGRYLSEALGHCGECHSPRGWLGQVDVARPLAGNDKLGRFASPDITPQGLASRGWDSAQLRAYLRTGVADHAVASDEMLRVVTLSTSRLNEADLAAMTTYLLGDHPPAPLAPPSPAATPAALEPGRRHYLNLCAGCHGGDGQGVPHVAPAMRGNSGLRDRDPHNLVVAILDGLPAHRFVGLQRMQDMPGFSAELDDADIAVLASWLRQRYGGQAAVEEAAVARLRQDNDGQR